MKTCVFIVIIHSICAIKCATITIAAVSEGNQTKKIQNFEKEKLEIYNQLNDAVADTVKTLKKINDSDAKQGIAYMQELLALIDKFNGTELELAQVHTVCNGSKECASNLTKTANNSIFLEDGRRNDKYKKSGYEHIKHAIIATGMFKNEEDLNRIRDEKVRNLLVLQTKLDRWLKLREAEKQRIKQYRLRQISQRRDTVTEDCPNFGDMKKKGKKSKGGGSGKSRKYPCCRKCCKKSYMGCL